jgi:hypothetical protein
MGQMRGLASAHNGLTLVQQLERAGEPAGLDTGHRRKRVRMGGGAKLETGLHPWQDEGS